MASIESVKSAKVHVENVVKGLIQHEKDYVGQGAEDSRRKLLNSARALVASLESPAERLARIGWLEPACFTSIRVGVDLSLFEKMAEAGASPKDVSRLAKMTGADAQLLDRILKLLAATNIVEETGPCEYTLNDVSTLLAGPIFQGLVGNCFDDLLPSFYTLPEFLKKNDYKNPSDKDNTAWKMFLGKDLHYFDWLNLPENSSHLVHFNNFMKSKTIGMKRWFSTTDLTSIFGAPRELDPDAAVLVDIGGNIGHDLIAFEDASPDHYKKTLVLQDLPDVVKNAALPHSSGIKVIPYDFFTPQPVKAAKAYYLHMVLHDWPDDKCREILLNTIPAMKKGYSKILLNESVISAQHAGWYETSVDVIMMAAHSATERTEPHWEKLLSSVGLRISKIWDCEGSPEKLIEAELAE